MNEQTPNSICGRCGEDDGTCRTCFDKEDEEDDNQTTE